MPGALDATTAEAQHGELSARYVPGGTYFFTLTTYNRRLLFRNERARELFGEKIREQAEEAPFRTVAIVLLWDHLHCLWTLPPGDKDYPGRWKRIKAEFTRDWLLGGGADMPVSRAKAARGRRGVWQPRYYEHTIEDETDLESHLDYLHFNPVKHDYVKRPWDWPWSSFRRFVEAGQYERDWGAGRAGRTSAQWTCSRVRATHRTVARRVRATHRCRQPASSLVSFAARVPLTGVRGVPRGSVWCCRRFWGFVVRCTHPTSLVRSTHLTSLVRMHAPYFAGAFHAPYFAVRGTHPTSLVRSTHLTSLVRCTYPTSLVRSTHLTSRCVARTLLAVGFRGLVKAQAALQCLHYGGLILFLRQCSAARAVCLALANIPASA